jgi:hypothetical protein
MGLSLAGTPCINHCDDLLKTEQIVSAFSDFGGFTLLWM